VSTSTPIEDYQPIHYAPQWGSFFIEDIFHPHHDHDDVNHQSNNNVDSQELRQHQHDHTLIIPHHSGSSTTASSSSSSAPTFWSDFVLHHSSLCIACLTDLSLADHSLMV
jgi:hypothetical protein